MAAITYPYSTISDAILSHATMPDKVKLIHTYCLKRLNIPGWIIQPADIAKYFKCSVKTVLRALSWFRNHGYGTKASDGKWIIYPSPQTPQPPDNNGLAPIETWTKMSIPEPVLMDKNVHLIEKEAFKEKETTTQPTETIRQPDPVTPAVVVFCEVFEPMPDSDPAPEPEIIIQPAPTVPVEEEKPLTYPEQLTTKQKSDIKHHIKKAPIEHRQAILSTLAHYLALGTIRTPIGWVRSRAEEAAKTGEFTPVGAASATITYNPDNDPTQARLKAERAKPKPDPEKAKTGVLQAKLAVRGML